MHDNELIRLAKQCQDNGELPRAAEIYGELLRKEPRNHRVLFLLGRLLLASGNPSDSSTLFRQALAIAPKERDYHNALGVALMAVGNYVDAEHAFRSALRFGGQAEYHNNLGVALMEQRHTDQAIVAFRRSLAIDSGFAEAHYNLWVCYRMEAKFEAAESSLKTLVANAKFIRSLLDLRKRPHFLRRSDDALAYLKQVVLLVPGQAELQCALGDAYQDVGELDEAVRCYQHAIQCNPHSTQAWYCLGCAQTRRKEYVSAAGAFRQALVAAPDWVEAEHNLGRALFELGQTEEALTHFENCAAHDASAGSALSRAMIALIIPGVPSATNAVIFNARRTWVERDLPKCSVTHGTPVGVDPPGRQPIRLGYISSFFQHQKWMNPVWSLLNHHDRSRFEIHGFASVPSSSLLGSGYHPDSRDHFYDISRLSNEEASTLIRSCGIDILVDLNGYSEIHRLPLFMSRPAPVIVGWFNLYATSGLVCFDYLIGDNEVILPSEESYYTERILRVSGSHLTFEMNYPVPAVMDPPSHVTRQVTFGSCSSQIKITNQVVAAWSEILSRTPNSQLIVRNRVLGSAECREFMYRQFAANGISPDRLQFWGYLDHFEYLKTYSEIDVVLDTFPYNGGTTTIDAIWQGVPVLTFWGDRWVSRNSASILRAGGLTEFVRTNVEDYVAFAIDLANSPETPEHLLTLRRAMRSTLRNSLLCDIRRFSRDMEKIYTTIHGGVATKNV